MHHEQAAAFAAEGTARISGVPGVAIATSGPGATNLLTGIGSCYFDSTPAVFITGQVNRDERKGDRPIRQLGFQETDIVTMAKPITKAAWSVDEPESLGEMLDGRVRARTSPVARARSLLDIPMDVQGATVERAEPRHRPRRRARTRRRPPITELLAALAACGAAARSSRAAACAQRGPATSSGHWSTRSASRLCTRSTASTSCRSTTRCASG